MLAQLERSTDAARHTTFTALLSISFLLPGLALQAGASAANPLILSLSIQHLVFVLGFLFYCFALMHYHWYHRYSHRYRKALKDIEVELGINVYRLRRRPRLGPFKFHFEWAIWILGLVYGCTAAVFIGVKPFLYLVAGVMGIYIFLLALSFFSPEEPLEQGVSMEGRDS